MRCRYSMCVSTIGEQALSIWGNFRCCRAARHPNLENIAYLTALWNSIEFRTRRTAHVSYHYAKRCSSPCTHTQSYTLQICYNQSILCRLSRGAFNGLVFLITTAATHCGLVADFMNAKHLLKWSENVLCEDTDDDGVKYVGSNTTQRSPLAVRRPLLPPKSITHRPRTAFDRLRNCPIWKETGFWDYTFDELLLSQLPMDVGDTQQRSEEFAFEIVSLKPECPPPLYIWTHPRVQITSICFTMLNLRLSSDMTTAVVIKLCTVSKLSEKSTEALIQLVTNVAKTLDWRHKS